MAWQLDLVLNSARSHGCRDTSTSHCHSLGKIRSLEVPLPGGPDTLAFLPGKILPGDFLPGADRQVACRTCLSAKWWQTQDVIFISQRTRFTQHDQDQERGRGEERPPLRRATFTGTREGLGLRPWAPTSTKRRLHAKERWHPGGLSDLAMANEHILLSGRSQGPQMTQLPQAYPAQCLRPPKCQHFQNANP